MKKTNNGFINYSKLKNETNDEYSKRIGKIEEEAQEERSRQNLIHQSKMKVMTEAEKISYLNELYEKSCEALSKIYPEDNYLNSDLIY